MISSLANPDMPPLMSPESQSPGLMGLAKLKMQDPKAKLAMAMMGQQLGQMGQALAPQPMPQSPRPQRFDMNGNFVG